jgi:hypothetical protein
MEAKNSGLTYVRILRDDSSLVVRQVGKSFSTADPTLTPAGAMTWPGARITDMESGMPRPTHWVCCRLARATPPACGINIAGVTLQVFQTCFDDGWGDYQKACS